VNTRISSKLGAFDIALILNSLIMGGVSYLFNSQTGAEAAVVIAHAAVA
jgi:hypothetical protein